MSSDILDMINEKNRQAAAEHEAKRLAALSKIRNMRKQQLQKQNKEQPWK